MYSDKWLKNKENKKTEKIILKNNIYAYYWLNKDDEQLGIIIDFEFANDSHIEIVRDEFTKLTKVLLKRIEKYELNLLKLLKEYFGKLNVGKGEELKIFKELLDNNNIDYKMISFN